MSKTIFSLIKTYVNQFKKYCDNTFVKLPSDPENGCALVYYNGSWVKQSGYPYKVIIETTGNTYAQLSCINTTLNPLFPTLTFIVDGTEYKNITPTVSGSDYKFYEYTFDSEKTIYFSEYENSATATGINDWYFKYYKIDKGYIDRDYLPNVDSYVVVNDTITKNGTYKITSIINATEFDSSEKSISYFLCYSIQFGNKIYTRVAPIMGCHVYGDIVTVGSYTYCPHITVDTTSIVVTNFLSS